MRKLACVLWTALAVHASACKEEMHPPPESEPAPVSSPAKVEKAAPQPASPAPEPAKPETQPTAAAEKSSGSTVGSTVTTDGTTQKEVTHDGYEVIRADSQQGKAANVEVQAPPGWKVAQPPDSPDPHAGKFTLPEALKGLPAKGKLTATIRTSMGTFDCQLFEDKAPITVANFVGLARGLRKYWSGKDRAWVARPYYDGTTFHRVIPEFMIQGGDWAGDGTGAVYYRIPDELHGMKHDRGGLMCMANRGPNTNEAQFFITEAAAAHLDSSYTIFGECSPVELVKRIARVPQTPHNNKPLTPVVIEKVIIERKVGGAAAASAPAAKPVVPEGKAVQVPAPAK